LATKAEKFSMLKKMEAKERENPRSNVFVFRQREVNDAQDCGGKKVSFSRSLEHRTASAAFNIAFENLNDVPERIVSGCTNEACEERKVAIPTENHHEHRRMLVTKLKSVKVGSCS
jgi:hypothetical protein